MIEFLTAMLGVIVPILSAHERESPRVCKRRFCYTIPLMHNVNLILAFLLEIIAFIGFAAVGFLFPIETLFQVISAVALFALLVVFWSRFMSPRAPQKVNLTTYYLVKFVLYGTAAFTIFYLYGKFEGSLFFTAALLNDLLLFKYNKNRF